MAQRSSSKLPSSVRIGPSDFTISTDPAALDALQNDLGLLLNGHTNIDELRILIRTRPLQAMQETLLHEMLHALIAAAGLAYERFEWNEETLIRRLSPTLMGIIRDNPDVMRFLTAK